MDWMFMSLLSSHVEVLSPKVVVFWSWGVWGIIRIGWALRVGPSPWISALISALIKGDTRELACSLPSPSAQRKRRSWEPTAGWSLPTSQEKRLQKEPHLGLPWWLHGNESACQCRRHGFSPQARKILRAVEPLSPCTCALEPWNHDYWRLCALEPCPAAREAMAMRSLWPATRVASTHSN